MAYVLNLVYLALLLLASPWIVWQTLRRGKYRQGLSAKLLGAVPPRDSAAPCVWFHAVSVGEVNLLAPLIDALARRRPDLECVISTTTMTGFALAVKRYPGRLVFYCPLDFSWAVARAMRRIRPAMLVLAELELWPNLIAAAKRHRARVIVVNGRLSQRSFCGYRRLGPLSRRLMRWLDLVAAQTPEYAQRFVALGTPPQRVHVCGSVKFDGAATDRDNAATRRLAALAGFTPSHAVFLAGSTQAPEEALALEIFRQLAAEFPSLQLVLAPRHPHRLDEVASLLAASGFAWRRRSELGESRGHALTVERQCGSGAPPRILLIDTVGELAAWWATAAIGFVGGSLLNRRGGQNMIEPAAYGVATAFGPDTRNFRDVVQALLAAEAAVVVHDEDEMAAFVRRCLEEPEYAAALGRRARQVVLQQRGAVERTLRLLEPLLPNHKCGESQPPLRRSA